ncbi:MAG: hypothetical protein AB8C95_03760 [Phycisphaeraceae bacterium]
MARTFVSVIIFVLCGSLLFLHADVRSDPFRGVPEASQLLRENPEAQMIEISADTLGDVLNDFRNERNLHHSANKRAAMFNFIAIVLSVVIYYMLRKRETLKRSDYTHPT